MDFDRIIHDFIIVAGLAGVALNPGDFDCDQNHPIPYSKNLTKLPEDYMAVYVFCYHNQALKVGKPIQIAKLATHHNIMACALQVHLQNLFSQIKNISTI